jgi:hypothetical protein
MSANKPTLRTYAWRGSLIAFVAAAILAFGLTPGRAWLGSPRHALPAAPGRTVVAMSFDPFPGSSLLSSYEVVFNGAKARFGHYRSALPADQVAAQFEERYGSRAEAGQADDSGTRQPAAEATLVRVVAPSYSVAGARDADGSTLGVVVFSNPKTGGSTYFIGRSGPSAKGWREGDVPGEDVSGVRPLRSRRVLCVDGLGGIPSRLLLYEGWGAISDTVEHFASEMPKAGWTRNADVESVIQKQLPGSFLSFLRGTRRTMVYIEREESSGKVRTAVVFSVKDWLPADRGL